jgi:hypothetical protein
MVLDVPEFLDDAEIRKFVSMGVAVERTVLSEADKVFTEWLKSGVSPTFTEDSSMKTIKLDVVRKIFINPLDVKDIFGKRKISLSNEVAEFQKQLKWKTDRKAERLKKAGRVFLDEEFELRNLCVEVLSNEDQCTALTNSAVPVCGRQTCPHNRMRKVTCRRLKLLKKIEPPERPSSKQIPTKPIHDKGHVNPAKAIQKTSKQIPAKTIQKKEKETSKTRKEMTCKECGLPRKGHPRRGCPIIQEKKEISSKRKRDTDEDQESADEDQESADKNQESADKDQETIEHEKDKTNILFLIDISGDEGDQRHILPEHLPEHISPAVSSDDDDAPPEKPDRPNAESSDVQDKYRIPSAKKKDHVQTDNDSSDAQKKLPQAEYRPERPTLSKIPDFSNEDSSFAPWPQTFPNAKITGKFKTPHYWYNQQRNMEWQHNQWQDHGSRSCDWYNQGRQQNNGWNNSGWRNQGRQQNNGWNNSGWQNQGRQQQQHNNGWQNQERRQQQNINGWQNNNSWQKPPEGQPTVGGPGYKVYVPQEDMASSAHIRNERGPGGNLDKFKHSAWQPTPEFLAQLTKKDDKTEDGEKGEEVEEGEIEER